MCFAFIIPVILFDATAKELLSYISLSDCSLQGYKNRADFCISILFCNHAELVFLFLKSCWATA